MKGNKLTSALFFLTGFLFAAAGQAQNIQNNPGSNHANKFEQLGTILPTPNEYRAASGAPGPKYWQQRADYDIKATLDEKNLKLSGTETVTLTANQIPAHTHQMVATTAAASTGTPGPTVLPGTVSDQTMYVTDTSGGTPFTMAPQSMTTAGGSQPHENCMPTLTVQYCIAWAGIFPTQG